MPAGAAGRLPPLSEESGGTRQSPALEAAKLSRRPAAPEKKVTWPGPAPARSARSEKRLPPSHPAGSGMPIFSQIRASGKGPRFLKKRGSAIGVSLQTAERYFLGGAGGGALR